MKYEKIPSELFKLNRQRFMAQMRPNSIAIFQSNDLMPRSGDTTFTFRQNADLFYLSGLDQEETVLVLFPNCPKGKSFEEVVFTRATNDYIRVWEGYKYTREQAAEISGVANVLWTDAIPSILNELILLADTVYLNPNENDRAHHGTDDKNTAYAKSFPKQYPSHTILRSQPILKGLRMIKSQHEIAQIQKACDITEKAFRAVLAETKVGQNEYEVEALITYHYLKNGASGHAYNPIVASGENACILHYNDNCRPLKNGDVLLLDVGAEYANYAADLSRSIPVNGRFSPRQRQVYDAVLRVKNFAETLLVVGNQIDAYHKEVGHFMESELIGLGLLTAEQVKHQHPNAPAYKKYFPHGTSHHLGLDVHDLCNRYEIFQAGMIYTCEPGIYIPEEGIGIRLEDDILLTADGNINLMKNIPIHPEEIEELMNAHVVA